MGWWQTAEANIIDSVTSFGIYRLNLTKTKHGNNDDLHPCDQIIYKIILPFRSLFIAYLWMKVFFDFRWKQKPWETFFFFLDISYIKSSTCNEWLCLFIANRKWMEIFLFSSLIIFYANVMSSIIMVRLDLSMLRLNCLGDVYERKSSFHCFISVQWIRNTASLSSEFVESTNACPISK